MKFTNLRYNLIIVLVLIQSNSVSGSTNNADEGRNNIDTLTNIFKPLVNVNQNDSNKTDSIPKYWKAGGSGNILFSQLMLSHWSEGGESTITGLGDFSFDFGYKKGKTNWDNSFDIKYGLIKAGDYNFRKNEDIIEFNSKFGQKAYNNFYYSIMFNFKTQSMIGYEFPNDSVAVSDFMSPGFLVYAIGMDFKPGDNLSLLLSPFTMKSTYVLNDTINETKYGLEVNERSKHEPGGYLKIISKVKLAENINLVNKLDFFTNYIHNPQNIDVNWETMLTLKINSHIKTAINTRLIYDDDIMIPIERTIINASGVEETVMGYSKKVQFKELLSVGFSYNF